MKARLILATMFLVTAWSLWSFAQAKRPSPHPGGGAPTHQTTPPPRALPAPPAVSERRPEEPKAEAKDEAESEEPAPFNLTEFGQKTPPYLAMLINFGILAAGYYLLGRKPIASALQARRDEIAKEIEEAQRMRKEAEERAKIYQAKLEKLEEEVRQAREALVRAGEAERERILAEAEANAERMRKDAEFLVEQELKQIRQDLLRETVDMAVSAAEELLKKRVTAADQERLAEDYLADLGGKKGGADVARPQRVEAGEPS